MVEIVRLDEGDGEAAELRALVEAHHEANRQ